MEDGLKLIGNSIRAISPRAWLAARHAYLISAGHAEVLLRFLSVLVLDDRAVLDIGANRGIYTYRLSKLASKVYAFEPNPDLAADLRYLFGRRVEVFEVALSNSSGVTELRLPLRHGRLDSGLATIEAHNDLEGLSTRKVVVQMACLDEYQLPSIGFAKIDVEGHEIAVLEGAEKTLSAHRPVLLVELEERHRKNSIVDTVSYLERLGYRGYFVREAKVLPVSEFNLASDQDLRTISGGVTRESLGRYVNNFIFVHHQSTPDIPDRLQRRLQR
jgi:FkbM family methyltransferase